MDDLTNEINIDIDDVILKIEQLSLPFPKWVGSLDQIYNCDMIAKLKKANINPLLNILEIRYLAKKTYHEKIPILMIFLGVLDCHLPHSTHSNINDEKVQNNIRYLESIGVFEKAPLPEIIWLMQSLSNDCNC